MTELKIHPACAVFPLIDDSELKELAADIQVNGLQSPIVILPRGESDEIVILDGRNRQRACESIKFEPSYEEYKGELSPEAYVLSANIRRRSLSKEQRAFLAAALANMERGGDRKSKGQNTNLKCTAFSAAIKAGCSKDDVNRAKAILRSGAPELIEAARAGKVKLRLGANVAGNKGLLAQIKGGLAVKDAARLAASKLTVKTGEPIMHKTAAASHAAKPKTVKSALVASVDERRAAIVKVLKRSMDALDKAPEDALDAIAEKAAGLWGLITGEESRS